MMNQTKSIKWPKSTHTSLLLSILIFLILSPFFGGYMLKTILRLLMSVVILTSINSISHHKYVFRTALGLLIPTFILNWLTIAYPQEWIIISTYFVNIVFFSLVFIVLFHGVFLRKNYDYDMLFGALSIYLLLGIIWALIYSFFHTVDPSSFMGVLDPHNGFLDEEFETFLYYSFVTLTTLGYGDITPVTQNVRHLAILEAVIGQFYIATLVAGLIGTITFQKGSKHS